MEKDHTAKTGLVQREQQFERTSPATENQTVEFGAVGNFSGEVKASIAKCSTPGSGQNFGGSGFWAAVIWSRPCQDRGRMPGLILAAILAAGQF